MADEQYYYYVRVFNETAKGIADGTIQILSTTDLLTATLVAVGIALVLPLVYISLQAGSSVRNFATLTRLPRPKGWPLLGNLALLRPDHHKLLLEYAREIGPIYVLRILWIQVRDFCEWRPVLLRSVLIHKCLRAVLCERTVLALPFRRSTAVS
ncbi:hypothetical protein WJX73_003621 [Symbiochloris irregularis]|uniref:Uncharacterized protein n=1 Tax=Symbiochloris irregularis TaxID=706552 RepID=A0AAW1PXM5_9CHLO